MAYIVLVLSRPLNPPSVRMQAYFCQPALSAVCQGPLKKYPPITGQQMAESRYMDLDWMSNQEAKPAASKGTADHKAFKPIAVA